MPNLVDAWADAALAAHEARGHTRRLTPLSSPQGAVVSVGGRQVVNFSANDSLGLCADGRLAAAVKRGVDTHGVGAGASRLVVGDSEAHQALERALATFERTEAALLFNSGFAANTGLLPVLFGEGDVVFSDALNHASLVDGCRLSKARVVIYPHRDMGALARLLAEVPGRRRGVLTDTVFSMDGDVAPLAELRALCDASGAALVVDEAHATGVLGPRGAGACEAAGVRPDVLMGTLSKALGCVGAYVAGSAALRSWLVHDARPLVFSTALPPALCEAALAALHIVEAEPERRALLWDRVRQLTQGLTALGLPAHGASHIFSVVLGSPERAVLASQRLLERGLLVRPIRPPTVPVGTSRLRVSLSAAHSEAQVAALLDALAAVLPNHSRA